MSARHLSFVETGRVEPSPELVIALAEGLDVPLRERNTMLLAAGYAPRYGETSLDDPAMAMMHVGDPAAARRGRPLPRPRHRPPLERRAREPAAGALVGRLAASSSSVRR